MNILEVIIIGLIFTQIMLFLNTKWVRKVERKKIKKEEYEQERLEEQRLKNKYFENNRTGEYIYFKTNRSLYVTESVRNEELPSCKDCYWHTSMHWNFEDPDDIPTIFSWERKVEPFIYFDIDDYGPLERITKEEYAEEVKKIFQKIPFEEWIIREI